MNLFSTIKKLDLPIGTKKFWAISVLISVLSLSVGLALGLPVDAKPDQNNHAIYLPAVVTMPEEKESNNSLANATGLGNLNLSYYGYHAEKDFDYYRVELTSAGKLSVHLKVDESRFLLPGTNQFIENAVQLVLQDSNGDRLVPLIGTPAFKIENLRLTSEVYFILVYTAANVTGGSPYELELSFTPDPNSPASTATPPAQTPSPTSTPAPISTPEGGASCLAFTRNLGENDRPIFMKFGLDGTGGETRLTGEGDGINLNPIFSPDGTKLVFSSNRDGNYEIYVMNVDGSDVERLTYRLNTIDRHPSWSPDGSRIAFLSGEEDPGNFDIYIMNSDGSGDAVNITQSNDFEFHPDWAKNGLIAFASNKDSDPTCANCSNIFTIDPESREITPLSEGGTSEFKTPMISPDGNYLVAMYQITIGEPTDYARNLKLYSFADERWEDLTPLDDVAESRPSWSPDSKQVVYSSGGGADHELYRIDVFGEDQTVTQITNNFVEDSQGHWAPNELACQQR
ncbi:MAG: hypothetical protein AAGD96_12395 [Chloroflexota bacterium]